MTGPRLPVRVGSLVRINPRGKVYRVRLVDRDVPRGSGNPMAWLEADANHPEAAKRLHDAFRGYRPDTLIVVTR